MIFTKIIIDEPFDIPLAVICSASHIINNEPATSVITAIITFNTDGFVIIVL